MNESNDNNNQPTLIGSRQKTGKNRVAAKVLLLFVIAAVVVGGAAYAYWTYSQKQTKEETQQVIVSELDLVRYDYNEKERQKRIGSLEKKDPAEMTSDKERTDYFDEYNTLLSREGKCAEYEKSADDMSQYIKRMTDVYIGVARCYETNDGTKAEITRAVEKAQKYLKNLESEDDREYFKGRIRYYRSLDV